MSKIGILGGTFNPIHNGHLLLAEQARCFYGLDQVLFIPSGCSYMKRQEEILPGKIRFQMVQLAIADNPYFCVSDMEIVREGNSYTCETIPGCMRSIRRTSFIILSAQTRCSRWNSGKIRSRFLPSALRQPPSDRAGKILR